MKNRFQESSVTNNPIPSSVSIVRSLRTKSPLSENADWDGTIELIAIDELRAQLRIHSLTFSFPSFYNIMAWLVRLPSCREVFFNFICKIDSIVSAAIRVKKGKCRFAFSRIISLIIEFLSQPITYRFFKYLESASFLLNEDPMQ